MRSSFRSPSSPVGFLSVGFLGVVAFTVASTSAPQSLTLVGSVAVPATVVSVNEGYAYVASNTELSIIDVRDPSNPTVRGSLSLSEQIWDITVIGTHAYIANNFVGLQVVDVADPEAPTVVGTYANPSHGQTVTVSTVRDHVVTTNNQTGLDVIDVSDPTNPRVVGSFLTGGYSRQVVGVGRLALVADQPDGLYVIAVCDQGEPVELAVHFSEGEATTQVSVVAGGTQAQIVDATGLIEFVDLTDPTTPTRIATMRPAGPAVASTTADTTMYLSLARAGVQMIDVGEPRAPVESPVFDTPGDARMVAVSDDLVFVADTEALVILRRQ